MDLRNKGFTGDKEISEKDEENTSKGCQMNKGHFKTAHNEVELEIIGKYDKDINFENTGTKKYRDNVVNDLLMVDVKSVQDDHKHNEKSQVLNRRAKTICNDAILFFNSITDADKGESIPNSDIKTVAMSTIINEVSNPVETKKEKFTGSQGTREYSFVGEENIENFEGRSTSSSIGRVQRNLDSHSRLESYAESNIDKEQSIGGGDIIKHKDTTTPKYQSNKYQQEDLNQERRPERTSNREETFHFEEERIMERTDEKFLQKEQETSHQGRIHQEATFCRDSDSGKFNQEEMGSLKPSVWSELGMEQGVLKSSKKIETTPEITVEDRFRDTKQAWPTTSETVSLKQKSLNLKAALRFRSNSKLKNRAETDETKHGKTPNYLQNVLHGKEVTKSKKASRQTCII